MPNFRHRRRLIMRRRVIAATGPTFVFAGSDDAFTAGSGSTSTFTSTSIDIGTATSDRFVIVAAADQNANPLPSVTVNGVSLTEQINDGATSGRIWSGLVGATGGAGAATIVLNYTGAGFTDRAIFVYVGRGMSNTTGAATTVGTAGSAPTSMNISVTAGDLLVGVNRFTLNYSGSTQAPTATNANAAGPTFQSPWWSTILATNASFNIAFGAGANACAATFR
jgi:hypothetical protein